MSRLLGLLQLLGLLAAPPALFSRLFALPWYRQALEEWAAPLLPAAGTVLEVGCAGGDFARTLATAQRRVVAVDRSAAMLRRARRGSGPVRFVLGTAERLPLPARHFDAVLAASLFNVVSEPGAVLGEMGRVCRDGGVVSVLVPNRTFTNADARRLVAERRLSGFARTALLAWHRLGRKMDGAAVEACFRASGLRAISQHHLLGGMLLAVSGQR